MIEEKQGYKCKQRWNYEENTNYINNDNDYQFIINNDIAIKEATTDTLKLNCIMTINGH